MTDDLWHSEHGRVWSLVARLLELDVLPSDGKEAVAYVALRMALEFCPEHLTEEIVMIMVHRFAEELVALWKQGDKNLVIQKIVDVKYPLIAGDLSARIALALGKKEGMKFTEAFSEYASACVKSAIKE